MRVLHILHNGPYAGRNGNLGGVELHVQDLIKAANRVEHWSLTPCDHHYILSSHGSQREWLLKQSEISLSEIIRADIFPIVHVHHLKGFDQSRIEAALQKHANYFVSIHDYHLICPRINLLTPENRLCTLQECAAACYQKPSSINILRNCTKNILKVAKKRICFSESSAFLCEKALQETFAWTVYPHGVESRLNHKRRQMQQPSADEPLRVAFLGNLDIHKGSLLLKSLVNTTQLSPQIALEWHLVGSCAHKLPHHVHQHGAYQRENLMHTLNQISPHLILILSLCPETYCYTLDEAIHGGVPVIVSPVGAIAERTLKNGTGWVLPELSENAVLEKLRDIVTNWQEYEQVQTTVNTIKPFSNLEEGLLYEDLYLASGSEYLAESLYFVNLDRISKARIGNQPYLQARKALHKLLAKLSPLLPLPIRKRCLKIKNLILNR